MQGESPRRVGQGGGVQTRHDEDEDPHGAVQGQEEANHAVEEAAEELSPCPGGRRL